jgi:uridine kinase
MEDPGGRADVLARLAARIDRTPRPHPLRVAVDGVDAAGKTTLADELVAPLTALGRPVIRASVDGFHRPRADRHRRGPDSPDGYYLDSFDHDAIHASLLAPLGPGGTRRYRTAVFDHRADRPAPAPWLVAPERAVLVFDGVFLLRPELDAGWDLRVFLAVDPGVALARAVERDRSFLGGRAAAEERYRRRYGPGQRRYLEAARPWERADVVVENSDPSRPGVRSRD